MRPALNIKDMVLFYELMIVAPKDKIHKQAFNVSDKNKTIKEFAEMIKEVIGNSKIKFEVTPTDDKRSYHVNTDKIKNILGFECKFGIKEAIQSLINAYNGGLIVDGLNNPFYYNIKRMKEINLK
jgi:nucleoside-diphosphate-sugar epimerase